MNPNDLPARGRRRKHEAHGQLTGGLTMSMLANAPCRPTDTRCSERRALTAVADLSGHVWTHPNPLHLYRWVSRRNELLRTLGAAVQRQAGCRAG